MKRIFSKTKRPVVIRRRLGLTVPDFLDLRAQTKALEGLSVVMNFTYIFGGSDNPERVLGTWISTEIFQMLGVKPVRGRLFEPGAVNEGAAPVAILSHCLWPRRFGGQDDLIGRSVLINGRSVTIVGVLPAGFRFPDFSEMWMPFIYNVRDNPRGSYGFPCYARLKDGVSLEQAQAELTTLAANFAQQSTSTDASGLLWFSTRADRVMTT